VLVISEECLAAALENDDGASMLTRRNREPSAFGYDASVDWWSYGAMLYEILYGLPPFYDEKVEDTYTKIRKCTVCRSDHDSSAETQARTFYSNHSNSPKRCH
jgi:serine/threonine protein kinase